MAEKKRRGAEPSSHPMLDAGYSMLDPPTHPDARYQIPDAVANTKTQRHEGRPRTPEGAKFYNAKTL